MRIGVVLPADLVQPDRMRLAAQSDALGLDHLQVEGSSRVDPLLTAASLAAATRWTRIVAEVSVGLHPVHLAERICVADQSLAGRLTVVLRSRGDAGELAETVALLQEALAPRPVRHRGQRWQVPAELPENDAATWSSVRVTPGPVQPQLPIWLSGVGADEVAAEFGLPALFHGEEGQRSAADWWPSVDRRWGHVARRMSRPLRVTLGGTADVGPTAGVLLAQRATWGLDTTLLRVPAPDETLLRVVATLRASVQLDELPVGLEDFWSGTMPLDRLTDA